MKKMNKILSVMMAAAMTVSMTACGGDTASDNTSAATDNSAAAATESTAAGNSDGQKYTIGILQQLEHPALDAASQGFEDALTELLGADNVTFTFRTHRASRQTVPLSQTILLPAIMT